MRVAAKSLAALGVLLVGMQLVRFPHTNPPVESDLDAPPAVKHALRDACYDCHSSETRWPWYTQIAPLSWLAYRDVREGRRRLNFSAWSSYSDDPETAATKLAGIARFVANGDMAPWYYRWLHPEAHLDDAQRESIFRWVKTETAAVKSSSP